MSSNHHEYAGPYADTFRNGFVFPPHRVFFCIIVCVIIIFSSHIKIFIKDEIFKIVYKYKCKFI